MFCPSGDAFDIWTFTVVTGAWHAVSGSQSPGSGHFQLQVAELS